LAQDRKGVDARQKAGHDERGANAKFADSFEARSRGEDCSTSARNVDCEIPGSSLRDAPE
jgi:hypothetical protein